jgi:hypothetical protein
MRHSVLGSLSSRLPTNNWYFVRPRLLHQSSTLDQVENVSIRRILRAFGELRTLRRGELASATAAIVYRHPMPANGRLDARLEYAYRSGYYYDVANNPSFFQPGFGLMNIVVNFQPADGRWYAFASGRNLTDEDYFYHVFIQSSPGLPATYEIGAGYRF